MEYKLLTMDFLFDDTWWKFEKSKKAMKCKKCSKTIAANEFRVGLGYDFCGAGFETKVVGWFHPKCALHISQNLDSYAKCEIPKLEPLERNRGFDELKAADKALLKSMFLDEFQIKEATDAITNSAKLGYGYTSLSCLQKVHGRTVAEEEEYAKEEFRIQNLSLAKLKAEAGKKKISTRGCKSRQDFIDELLDFALDYFNPVMSTELEMSESRDDNEPEDEPVSDQTD